MTSEAGRTVPAGAVATALAMVEMLSGRAAGDPASSDRALGAAVDRWGIATITEAFGALIYTAVNTTEWASGDTDALHVILPNVLTRFRRMRLPEVPEEALPLVGGLLTAACLGQGPYEWRTDLGPSRPGEVLVWAYTAWLLVDFIDSIVFEGSPGRFAEVLGEVLRADLEDC